MYASSKRILLWAREQFKTSHTPICLTVIAESFLATVRSGLLFRYRPRIILWDILIIPGPFSSNEHTVELDVLPNTHTTTSKKIPELVYERLKPSFHTSKGCAISNYIMLVEIILLCVVGCLFFAIASIRFIKQLKKQEEEMANLRATRRQEARDRAMAIEEFLDLQEQWRLQLIHEHFEFHTVSMDDLAAAATASSATKDIHRKVSDMDKTNVTVSSSSDSCTDDDEENQRKESNLPDTNTCMATTTTENDDHEHPSSKSIQMEFDNTNHNLSKTHHLEDDSRRVPLSHSNQGQEEDDKESNSRDIRIISPIPIKENENGSTPSSNDTDKSSTGILSSWRTFIRRPVHHIQPKSFEDDEGDDVCCCICLEPYQPKDTVCRAKESSSACHHMFHRECALQWFMRSLNHNQCPMCRVTLLPDTLSFDNDLIHLPVSNQQQGEQLTINNALDAIAGTDIQTPPPQQP